MDGLRGAAVVLVLVWHAVAVPALYGYPMPSAVLAANDALLPFRMPTLMFLSGLLLPRSLAKPLPDYYLGKLRILVWPYLLWAALHMALVGPTAPIWHPNAWRATGYLWFLAFVAYFYLLAPLLRRVPPWVVSAAMFGASALVTDTFSVRLLYFGGFFFAGAFVATRGAALDQVLRRRRVVAGCAVLAAVLAAVSAVTDVEWDARWAGGSIAGIMVAMAAARRLEGRAAWLERVGASSIVYYVSHFPVMLGVLALCRATGVDDIGVVALLNVAVACAVGAALARWRHQPPVRWLFEAPVALGRSSRPPQAKQSSSAPEPALP